MTNFHGIDYLVLLCLIVELFGVHRNLDEHEWTINYLMWFIVATHPRDDGWRVTQLFMSVDTVITVFCSDIDTSFLHLRKSVVISDRCISVSIHRNDWVKFPWRYDFSLVVIKYWTTLYVFIKFFFYLALTFMID